MSKGLEGWDWTGEKDLLQLSPSYSNFAISLEAK
jgi:hypothetical protein